MALVLSFAEFVGLILGFVGLIVLIYVLIYEYRAWRARRITKLVVKAGEE